MRQLHFFLKQGHTRASSGYITLLLSYTEWLYDMSLMADDIRRSLFHTLVVPDSNKKQPSYYMYGVKEVNFSL